MSIVSSSDNRTLNLLILQYSITIIQTCFQCHDVCDVKADHSSTCVFENDYCDGVTDCDDNYDEDPSLCVCKCNVYFEVLLFKSHTQTHTRTHTHIDVNKV